MHAKLRVPLWKRGLLNETGYVFRDQRLLGFQGLLGCPLCRHSYDYPYLIAFFRFTCKIINFGFKRFVDLKKEREEESCLLAQREKVYTNENIFSLMRIISR